MVWFGSVIWLDLIDFLRQNQLDWIFLSEWNWISQFSSIILINDGDPIKKFFVWLPSWQSSDNWGEIYPCTRKRLNFHFHESIRFRVQQPNRPRHNPILPSGKEPLPIKTTATLPLRSTKNNFFPLLVTEFPSIFSFFLCWFL